MLLILANSNIIDRWKMNEGMLMKNDEITNNMKL